MKFEDMQKIWDTQTQAPLYTLRENDLVNIIERKINHTERSVRWFEQGLILINLMVSAFLGYKLIGAHDFQIVILGSMIGVALSITAYLWWGRHHRLKRQARQAHLSNYSLLGSLDAAIEDRDYLIKKARSFSRWYLLPFGATLLLAMWYKFTPEKAWIWILIGGAMLFASFLPGWEVRHIHAPQKKSLEDLRNLLIEEVPEQEEG